MTTFKTMTPNLVVADMQRSITFYRDVVGFDLVRTVPDDAPFDFAWMQSGPVNVFLNAIDAVRKESPALVDRPIGGSLTLYFVVEDVDGLFTALRDKAAVVMAPTTQPYGMREFAVTDPDGYFLTFAQELEQP
jgi:lactoylglutathione lyase